MQKLLAKYNDSFLKWGLAAILLVIPLYPKFPLFNIPGTYVAVRAEDFLISFVTLFFLYRVFKNPKEFFADKINQAIFLFFVVTMFSVLSAIFVTHTVDPHIAFFHWVRRIEYIIPFFVAASFVRSQKQLPFFIEILVIDCILIFLYALGQIYLSFPVISTQNQEYAKGVALRWTPGARLHSTFGGHYDLSAFQVLVLPILAVYLLALKNIFNRIFVFSGIASSFWLLLAAGSRVSVVSYLGGICITLWLLKKRLILLIVMIISLIFITMSGDLVNRYRNTVEKTGKTIFLQIQQKIIPPVKGADFVSPSPTVAPSMAQVSEDRSTSIRLNVEWPRALRALFKNPLLGTGFSSISLATDSDYLRMLGETGLLGFFAFLLIIARIAKRLIIPSRKPRLPAEDELKSLKMLAKGENFIEPRVNPWLSIMNIKGERGLNGFIIGALGVLIAILINATFIDVFEASKVAIPFWTIIGMAVGIVKSEK